MNGEKIEIGEGYRGTGRTTRMLEQAFQASTDGDVLVFIRDTRMVGEMLVRLRQLHPDEQVTLVVSDGIRFRDRGEIRFVPFDDVDRVQGRRFVSLLEDHLIVEELLRRYRASMGHLLKARKTEPLERGDWPVGHR
jgi:hypothetical protein